MWEGEVIWSVSWDMCPSSKHVSCLHAINCLISLPRQFLNNCNDFSQPSNKRITNTAENLKQIKGPLLVMSRVVQLLLMHHALRRLSARLVRPAMRHVNRSVLWQTQIVLTRALKKKVWFWSYYKWSQWVFELCSVRCRFGCDFRRSSWEILGIEGLRPK